MCVSSSTIRQNELSRRNTNQYELAVLKATEAFIKCGNPFTMSTNNSDLHNIVTGKVVPEESKHSILDARDFGQNSLSNFVETVFIKESTSFWNPLKKLQLNTFSSLTKPIIISKGKEKESILKVQQDLFARLLTVSKLREIDLAEVLQFELTSIPLSLFHLDGTMRKTSKSNLLKELELEAEPCKSIPEENTSSCSVIDFMAVTQSVTNFPSMKTFGDLVSCIEKIILSSFKESSIVVIVPDRYDIDHSIKSHERIRRKQTTSQEVKILRHDQKLPKLHDFLQNKKNKSNLIEWLFNYWKENFQSKLIAGQNIVLCQNDGSATTITPDSSQMIPFQCDHEEEDSKMFVYIHHLSLERDITRIIIKSPDTDVAVIACHQFASSFQHVQEMLFKTGTGQHRRYVPIHEIVDSLGTTTSKMLPSFHCITGFSLHNRMRFYKQLQWNRKEERFKNLEETFQSVVRSH